MPCYKDEKTGTWYCQFRYADFTGKRKQKRKRGFKTKREAQEWEREFHLQKAKSCDMTLASFVELYFNDREHHVRDTTMGTKRNVFDTKIVPLLGNRKMNEITALDIRDWQQRVKEMGEATGLPYSETYLYTIHAQLTALFNYAQTFYGLRFNPCDAAGYMGSSVAGEMLIITKDQYELLRKEFRNEAYLLAFDILFWTGCREGEMLALLSKDLTDDDQLRIYKTYHRKKGQDIFGPTKNSKKGGNRNVPIPHWLAEEFRTYCSRLYGLTPDDRVFYMTCTALNKELTRCTQLTYLPDIRVHDLRHSHVSLCIELGYSIVLVAKRIGDTVPVVMRTYAHLYPNKQQELVSKLEAIGSPTSNNDDSDLMSRPFCDVTMSKKPQKVSISRCFPGLSNYSSIINRTTISRRVQQVLFAAGDVKVMSFFRNSSFFSRRHALFSRIPLFEPGKFGFLLNKFV